MPEKTIESIAVRRLDILDEQGNADISLLSPLSAEEIRKMYASLVLARTFDQRALHLQREGRIGTYASILGQEAAQVGSAFALGKSDWVFPSFRETGVYLTMGYPPHQLFQYWGGDERGMVSPQGLNIFPISIPVGTHIPHAVGAAMAAKYRKDPIAVAAYFGDGGTSKGDFHEGFTMAGVFKSPVVFLCQNNQWAISVPRERQTAAKTLAQKAYAYGFEGIQVDGNDIFAVYKACRDAFGKARSGGGPTFIECVTYRMSHHTTADDATRYRQESEVEAWKERDPLLRLKRYMEKQGLWTEQYRQETEEGAKRTVDGAVRTAEALPPPHPEEMILSTYAELTPRQAKEIEDF
ncbi:MAG: pyruvate dehydrogenase (acetyl-transferring) E1 component subunit alpha [Nitrospirales bacterium]|nr:pyruvate dehydrogenase (acetyl-transferring) E1 component subunit alpha [Nitrospirales bacterium]